MILVYLIICTISSVLSTDTITASVTYDQTTKKFQIHNYLVDDPVAYGIFKDEIFITGWSYLEVKTYEKFQDPVQAYAAGLVEGYLTSRLLRMHYSNLVTDYCDGEQAYCERLQRFLQNNLDFLNFNINTKRQYDTYWHQIALILEQLHGVEDGFRNITSQPTTTVDVMGFLMLNVQGDLQDLEFVLRKKDMSKQLGDGHCSVLIKPLLNNRDLYVSHVTWNTYSSMLRILKKYSFKFHTAMIEGSPIIPGHTVSFSSQPGLLHSMDDFNIISTGLVTTETTIGNTNSSLWQYVVPQSVLEWQRSSVANRLAKNGKQWVELLSILNSGTYNNQWMVLDYNKFKPGEPLQDGLFYIVEQLPGYLHSGDMTYVLRNQGYWSSYNIPYFTDVFALAGFQEKVDQFGDFFSHDRAPRAQIFRRDQGKVVDVDSLIKLMRYNDYTNDPLSRCNCTPPYSADCAISSRRDLMPLNGSYPFPSLGNGSYGATDMKLTTYDLYKNFEFVAISGPTYDPLPPFQWSKSYYDKTDKHEGQPDIWQFTPITHKWT